jgi:hypothetical protein
LGPGSVSINPIVKSQEFQKNRAQLTQSEFLKKQDISEAGCVSI